MVLGSKEKTWSGVASGSTRRWRVLREEMQVSRMEAVVVNRKVNLAGGFGFSSVCSEEQRLSLC